MQHRTGLACSARARRTEQGQRHLVHALARILHVFAPLHATHPDLPRACCALETCRGPVSKRSAAKRVKADTAVAQQKASRARKRATTENEFASGNAAAGPRPKKKKKR